MIADQTTVETVWANCYSVIDPAATFPGGKMSRFGCELGEKVIDDYAPLKTVTIRVGL